tara:strand:- start:1054 stop:1374 length:321 start_codon:yes stop_codon:yes gene_type:complete
MTDIKRFIGNFEIRNPSGTERVYEEGDVVEFEGRQYVAIRKTSGYSPLHPESRSGWKKLTSTRSMNFTNSETEPEVAIDGDHWFDSSSGKLFIYIEDKDTKQWIEL